MALETGAPSEAPEGTGQVGRQRRETAWTGAAAGTPRLCGINKEGSREANPPPVVGTRDIVSEPARAEEPGVQEEVAEEDPPEVVKGEEGASEEKEGTATLLSRPASLRDVLSL